MTMKTSVVVGMDGNLVARSQYLTGWQIRCRNLKAEDS